MADEVKVSELPTSDSCNNAAIFVCDVAGVTSTVTRAIILTADTGEQLKLKGAHDTEFLFETNGGIFVHPKNGQGIAFFVTDTDNAHLVLGGDGSITGNAYGSGDIHWNCGGATIWMEDDGDVIVQCASGKVLTLSYDPLTSSDWSGDPATVWEALDRIASKVAAFTGGPIP